MVLLPFLHKFDLDLRKCFEFHCGFEINNFIQSFPEFDSVFLPTFRQEFHGGLVEANFSIFVVVFNKGYRVFDKLARGDFFERVNELLTLEFTLEKEFGLSNSADGLEWDNFCGTGFGGLCGAEFAVEEIMLFFV